MLQTLRIQNYALIDEIEVEFGEGLNVLTGETGAGKSIVVGALNLVLGARASAETLREGAQRATIDAVFRIPRPSRRLARLLEEHAIELDGDELLLSRMISAEGRSRAYASGNLVTVSVLSDIGDELVDLHGQHEHQSLLRRERQLDLLDAFGGVEKNADEVREQVQRLRAISKDLEALQSDDRERARRVDFLRFEVDEIDKAKLVPGEESEVRGRLNLINNSEKIFTLASRAYALLFESQEGTPALDALNAAARDLDELAATDPRFESISVQLGNVRSETEAIVEELRAYTEELEFDPAELDALNTRLSLIRDLGRKYGETVDAILAYRDQALSEVDSYENRDRRITELEAERTSIENQANGTAKALSKARRSAARKLDRQVTSTLQELGMEGGRFSTNFEDTALSADGIDRVEFFLAANPGERLRPLRQVASGGEISRIMLALKAVFAGADKIPTLVFDEIDAGVGGAVATKVSGKLRELAQSHQTICVTHLPQIAAAAQTHYYLSKSAWKGKTATQVTLVEDEARVEEVARLLDGSISEVSLNHARALLGEPAQARRKRA